MHSCSLLSTSKILSANNSTLFSDKNLLFELLPRTNISKNGFRCFCRYRLLGENYFIYMYVKNADYMFLKIRLLLGLKKDMLDNTLPKMADQFQVGFCASKHNSAKELDWDDFENQLLARSNDEEDERKYPANFPLRKGNFYDVEDETDGEHESFESTDDSDIFNHGKGPVVVAKNDDFLDKFFSKQASKLQTIRLGKKKE